MARIDRMAYRPSAVALRPLLNQKSPVCIHICHFKSAVERVMWVFIGLNKPEWEKKTLFSRQKRPESAHRRRYPRGVCERGAFDLVISKAPRLHTQKPPVCILYFFFFGLCACACTCVCACDACNWMGGLACSTFDATQAPTTFTRVVCERGAFFFFSFFFSFLGLCVCACARAQHHDTLQPPPSHMQTGGF